MTDGVPKATGNAYLAKATLPSTYADFKTAIEAGTQGLDLNFNAAGWATIGTLLSKAKLLPDDVQNALGLTGDASPADALGALNAGLASRYKIEFGSWAGTGTVPKQASPLTLTFDGKLKFFWVFLQKHTSDGHGFTGYPAYDNNGYYQTPLFVPDLSNWMTGYYQGTGNKWALTEDGKTLTRYATSDSTNLYPAYLYNESGKTYYYMSIVEV